MSRQNCVKAGKQNVTTSKLEITIVAMQLASATLQFCSSITFSKRKQKNNYDRAKYPKLIIYRYNLIQLFLLRFTFGSKLFFKNLRFKKKFFVSTNVFVTKLKIKSTEFLIATDAT